ncbi:MAG: putative DNA binding domain-containing protein [Anaerolineales bacterium]|nr:putative DNA binding domain-containing protein [Anaerolineales bacterium]
MARQSKRASNRTWRVMDLHLHTPASADYQEPKASYLDILQRAEARGLDIIAFTDHNTVAGIRRMKDEIRELEFLERLGRILPEEQRRLNEYRRLTQKILVLPGFEFTATLGFHILGIFSPDTPGRELEHLLLTLNVPRDQIDLGSANVGATSDVLTAYRLIRDAGGIAIAAHANSSNGVAMRGLGFGGQTRIAYTQDPTLAALEVTDLDQKGRRGSMSSFFNGSKPEYPRRMHCIQGSDAHRLRRDATNAKNLGVGDRATEILIDEVSFESLAELLAGNDFARTRPHSTTSEKEFDYIQQAREEGANIVQSFHESAQARGGKQYLVVSDVCAFANTNGGTIYVGIGPDPKQPPVGVPNPQLTMADLAKAIERMITPHLDCALDTLESRGKTVVRVLVPRGEEAPYAIDDNKIYVRDESETSLAVRDEIVQLVLRSPGRPPVAPPVTPVAQPQSPTVAPAQPAHPEAASNPNAAAAPAGTNGHKSLNAPRTGVEIVETLEREGQRFHTMRDLRNGNLVKNVTLQSARKLWHYALTEHESGKIDVNRINWQGDIALLKKHVRGGVQRYDMAQRTSAGVRVYYGVTADGLSGDWAHLVGSDDEA